MNKITILLFTILSLNACQADDKQQTIVVEKKYSISIPAFLTKTTKLNDEASLQFQHPWKEFYVIVIDESKSEMQKALVDNNLTEMYSNDIKGYSELLLSGFNQKIVGAQKTKIVETFVNNMPARLLTISGKFEGIDAFYSLAFIEGKDRYYQIMAWTLLSKKNEYKDKMNQIMHSLKEL